jgi:parallel beta-helix repeat protein
MKKLLSILFLISTAFIPAKRGTLVTTYYVSATDGNDGYSSVQAQNSSTPWKTPAHAMAAIASGVKVLFKCGDAFDTVRVSQNNLTFDSYGIGAQPIISGFKTLIGWTDMTGGIWKINVPTANNLKVVTINRQMQRMGRYPDYNSGDGGWLTYESFNGGTPSITDAQLTGTPNWTGATIAMKAYSYVINLPTVTAHSGGTLTYSAAVGTFGTVNSPGTANYGYFITNDLRTLTSFGEWYFNNTTKDLYMYFGSNNPASYSLQAAAAGIGFDCGLDGKMAGPGSTAHTNISINNIAVEGANEAGINASDGSNITITNCTVDKCWNGIFTWYTNTCTVTGNTVTNMLNGGIHMHGLALTNPTTCTNNTVRNIGLFEGMGDSGEGSTYGGIDINGQNVLISGNVVDSTGLSGIHWQGSNVLVEKNFVNHYCMKLDDNGGIYTWGETTETNRVVKNNIVINGIGNRQGRPENDGRTWALYNDGSSNNVSYLYNSTSVADGGGMLQNSGQNITITGNTFYNVPIAININRFPNTTLSPGQLVRNNRVSSNINFPTVSNFFYWNGQLNNPVTVGIQADLQAIGTFDSSYYRNDLAAPFDWFYHLTPGGVFVDPAAQNLASWQTYISGDVHSTAISTAVRTFEYNATNNPRVVTFYGFSKKDAIGNIFNNSVTIPAWSSKILFDNGVVSGGNISPVAKITGGGTIALPTNSVLLNSTGSYDPDGTINSYSWTRLSGPSTFTNTSPNSSATTISGMVAGTYTFQLAVTDNGGATVNNTVTIFVNASGTICNNCVLSNYIPK